MLMNFKKIYFAFCGFAVTALLFSCATAQKGHLEDPSQCMKWLFANEQDKIKEYADDCVNYRSENGVTMLMMAVSKGNMSLARFLLEGGANVNSVNGLKQNALHYAVIHKQPQMIDLLRQNGAEIKPNAYGITSLMMAIQLGDFEMVDLINPKFEDINVPADDGWTAIYFAIRKEDPKILDLLIARGACVNFKDQYVQTPEDFAKEVGWKYAIEKLKQGKHCDK